MSGRGGSRKGGLAKAVTSVVLAGALLTCSTPRNDPTTQPAVGSSGADAAAPVFDAPGPALDRPMSGSGGAGSKDADGVGSPDAPVDTRGGPSADAGCTTGEKRCPGGACVAAAGCCTDADCAGPHATATCSAGRCGPAICESIWMDCNPNVPGLRNRLDQHGLLRWVQLEMQPG
jgi:hypothetical protein